MHRMHRSSLPTARRVKEVTWPSQSLIGWETSSLTCCKDTWHPESEKKKKRRGGGGGGGGGGRGGGGGGGEVREGTPYISGDNHAQT